MHPSVRDWYAGFVAECENEHVLEIGSLDVNGSVREHLEPVAKSYVGIDIVDGPGVDLVASSHDIPFDDESFSVILCSEMLEHDSDPNWTFAEMNRVLQPLGTILLTTRSAGFPYHHPPDHWRFRHEHMHELAFTAGLEITSVIDDPMKDTHPGVFAAFWKPLPQ